ncbi:MAG: ABC transporter ATP-binding protein [Eubacteriales bacterium]|nr:ABC transporter ATP-binding protein [Lachnospiraceae bacterium]MDO5126244.1 ABC transporter ATP-binding protein [Eubacteriales bacterium]
MAYITCENLLLGYDGIPVAKNVNFTVSPGDYLCIIGENGAGKSTLMKTILHLTAPLGGTFHLGDGLKPYEIGYLPQQTVVQKDFPASVWEIVLSGTLSKSGFHPFYSKAQKKLAMDNLERMGITHLKEECYRNLSGGQQQRVLLARALCAASKIILLDEPVTGLDPKVMTEFYQLIESLNKEGITVIMISHDMHAALQYASHILHIEPENSFFGTKEEYLLSDAWKQMQAGGVTNE